MTLRLGSQPTAGHEYTRQQSYLHITQLRVYFEVIQCAKDEVSGQRQVSDRGPTFRITRGSFFATAAGGEISGVDSGDEADEASAPVASAATSP